MFRENLRRHFSHFLQRGEISQIGLNISVARFSLLSDSMLFQAFLYFCRGLKYLHP